LLEKKPKVVFNHIGRAYGILANAHSISSKETMNLLSLMRLGVDMGLFPGAERSLVDELFLTTQPAHLQKQFPTNFPPRSAICSAPTWCASG
jgi:protein arginine kinase